jgi:hypothetical protein
MLHSSMKESVMKNSNRKFLLFAWTTIFLFTLMPLIQGTVDQTTYKVQSYGLGNTGTQVFPLTLEQSKDLDSLFSSLKCRFKETTSHSEATKIITDGLGSLVRKSLLSQESYDKLVEKISVTNVFPCLLIGKASNTYSLSIPYRTFFPCSIILTLFLVFLMRSSNEQLQNLGFHLALVLESCCYNFLMISTVNPVPIANLVCFGHESRWCYYPSEGWMCSFGLNGIKSSEGEFYGAISRFTVPLYGAEEGYPGCIGFTGIKIVTEQYSYFLGTALIVRLN